MNRKDFFWLIICPLAAAIAYIFILDAILHSNKTQTSSSTPKVELSQPSPLRD